LFDETEGVGDNMKRIKTDYPGVYYRVGKRIGKSGNEKIFYVVFKKDGKLLEEKVGRQYADNMTAAKAAIFRSDRIEGRKKSRKEIRAEEQAKKQAEESKWTIQKLWEEYAKSKEDGKSLRIDKSRYNKYLKPFFELKEPPEIFPLDVERIKRKELKGKAPQTVKHVLNLLDRIVNYGVRKSLCQPLPFKIEKPKVHNVRTEDLTSDQIQNLLKAIEESPYKIPAMMMKMVLYTGMRRGELFKLRWDDINFDRGFICIRNPKGGQDQKIPMNEATKDLLSSIPQEQNSEFVFPGRNGEQRRSVQRAVRDIRSKARLPNDFRPLHGLRHVFASMLASSGQVDMYTLQKLLTHKSPVMTQRYAHLRDDALKRASSVAANIVVSIEKQKEQKKTSQTGT